MLIDRGTKKDIMMIPGKYFYTDQKSPCNKMRASFSIASEADIDRVSNVMKSTLVAIVMATDHGSFLTPSYHAFVYSNE